MSDFDGMVKVVREYSPQTRKIDTPIVPSEIDSARYNKGHEKAAVPTGDDL